MKVPFWSGAFEKKRKELGAEAAVGQVPGKEYPARDLRRQYETCPFVPLDNLHISA
jgi:hypothetical protein